MFPLHLFLPSIARPVHLGSPGLSLSVLLLHLLLPSHPPVHRHPHRQKFHRQPKLLSEVKAIRRYLSGDILYSPGKRNLIYDETIAPANYISDPMPSGHYSNSRLWFVLESQDACFFLLAFTLSTSACARQEYIY